MGIKQLSKVIQTHAPKSIKNRDLSYYANTPIAIDASLCIYQFLIAVRAEGSTLVDSHGLSTSHLVGLFYRTIRIITSGLKPLYVFDGLPPQLKIQELSKRKERRDIALREYEIAFEQGNRELMEKYSKRQTKVTKKHVDDCKRLLKNMGVSYIDAPSEAEAFCAVLCKKNVVSCVVTEDMDALTFGTSVLLRNVNASESRKLPITEYNLRMMLEEMEMSMESFVDLCILLGCDYCESVKGVGPAKAYSMIKKHGSIEEILMNENIAVPEDWAYEDARKIFATLGDPESEVNYKDNENVCEKDEEDGKENKKDDENKNDNDFVDDSIIDERECTRSIIDYTKIPVGVKYDKVDIDGVIQFLVVENGFSEERIKKGMERMLTAKSKGKQMRLEAFLVKRK